ncbi:MAG: hypothetical protein ALECFALPRED_003029 [Alectoria fallacina]|uniref:RRM domain-containing protein n=1 Tax=Alectoria fallacina TaxID=1903189 RepID=A0A8H3ECB9_9LECA|nr:MAG: hypothetical protein ALECFALPRED_003029 [Alectoria fallacina]
MAAEEDNFDIDIYGDGGEDDQNEKPEDGMKAEDSVNQTIQPTEPTSNAADHASANDQTANTDVKIEHDNNDVAQKIASTDESGPDPVQLPKQAPQIQGLKRKDGVDDRYVDPGATTALFVSELHWWINDDDVRGWANQSRCEDELEDITFSEHKVNGKSKGQAYVLFRTPQAATAAKHKIESFGEGQQYTKKFTVSYTNPYTNPFRTLPKDGPARNNAPANNHRSAPSSYGSAGAGGTSGTSQSFNNGSGGYRGNRGGGYNNRGGGMNNIPGYNRGGFQQPVTGSFQGSGMGGFQGSPIGGMQSYGGFQNRGGMMGSMRGGPMGMRGGRGGMNAGGMMGMPLTGMGMGAMGAMGMSMSQMNAGVGMQGMRGSHFYPHMNSIGLYGLSASPTGQSSPSIPQAMHYSLSTSASSPSSLIPGRPAPPMGSAPSSAWAHYTQYSPSSASSSPTRLSFQVEAPGTSLAPSEESTALAGESSLTGTQAHYNPAFFAQQQQGQQSGSSGDASWNPHGAKRTRQE